jgi:hypothetical protein
MRRYAVFGAGLMGRVIIKDLIAGEKDAEVTLFDRDEKALGEAERFVGSPRLAIRRWDASDRKALVEALRGRLDLRRRDTEGEGRTPPVSDGLFAGKRAQLLSPRSDHPRKRKTARGRSSLRCGIRFFPGADRMFGSVLHRRFGVPGGHHARPDPRISLREDASLSWTRGGDPNSKRLRPTGGATAPDRELRGGAARSSAGAPRREARPGASRRHSGPAGGGRGPKGRRARPPNLRAHRRA